MSTTEKTVPAGYRQDAKGNLIPEANIKELDKLRDSLVLGLVHGGKEIARCVEYFKNNALRDIAAFCDLAKMEYDAPMGGKKGNVTLFSFDGRYKVIRAVDENIAFNEQLEAAKALIDECLTDWTKQRQHQSDRQSGLPDEQGRGDQHGPRTGAAHDQD